MKPFGAFVMLILLLCEASLALADVVELKTGQRIEGEFKEVTGSGVVIGVGGQAITFPREKVRAIYFGKAPELAGQPSALQEALRALKALRSVTEGSVNYRDYAPRVSDTKITVDRYLNEPGQGDTELRNAIKDAIGLYVFASSAWNTRVSNSGVWAIVGDPMIERCPALKQKLSGTPLTGNQWKDIERGVRISFEIPTIWSCASDKIAEAERILKGNE